MRPVIVNFQPFTLERLYALRAERETSLAAYFAEKSKPKRRVVDLDPGKKPRASRAPRLSIPAHLASLPPDQQAMILAALGTLGKGKAK